MLGIVLYCVPIDVLKLLFGWLGFGCVFNKGPGLLYPTHLFQKKLFGFAFSVRGLTTYKLRVGYYMGQKERERAILLVENIKASNL